MWQTKLISRRFVTSGSFSGAITSVKSAHGSQYKIQPLFGGDWLKNRLKRCYFTKTTTNGPKIEESRSCIFSAVILRGICTTF